MKIAIFSRYPLDSGRPKGGVESVTVVLVKALAQFDDLDVHVITLERDRATIAIEHDADVTVHRLPGSRWPQMLDILMGPGRKRLIRYIMNLEPDVLHTHETYGLAMGGCPIPHVFTLHGFDHANLVANSARFAGIRSRLWRRVERYCLPRQKDIISISPYVRQMIEPLTEARIHEIDNPVDERFFDIVPCPEPGRVLCVGWLNERKNTLGAIESFARVVKNGTDGTLVIAGQAQEAAYFEKVKACIGQNGLSDKVELLGHIDHGQLDKELARASVFLLPSRQENSPMAIAEAMAAGVPAIAANRCGMPYMIDEGKTGYLVDPESTEQIADRLSELIADSELCGRMGQAGREVAKKRFHPHVVALKTRDVYRQIRGETVDSEK